MIHALIGWLVCMGLAGANLILGKPVDAYVAAMWVCFALMGERK